METITLPALLGIALTAAFSLWAGVVGFGVNRIVKELGSIRSDFANEMHKTRLDLKEESQKLNQYVVQTESRLAIIEDRIFRDLNAAKTSNR